MQLTTIFLLVGLLAVTWLIHRALSGSEAEVETEARAEMDAVAALGDVIPPSLHPIIDPNLCIGSGACVSGCPEKKVIGVVGGAMRLLNPLACVGHGACASACPMGAIDLVFGTERRGVELPKIDEHFQTSQAGVYIIGELGGMGLIRNAMRQGKQAAEHVAARCASVAGEPDAIVVGAGPAGLAATLQLMAMGKRVELLEQDQLGGTILHYPRGKVVMTGPLDIPLYGLVKRKTMSKEELVALWAEIQSTTGLQVRTETRVTALRREGGSWAVEAGGEILRSGHVLLALGRRGSPRKLGVPGEELAKVAYRLLEPNVFANLHVLVVGGGNSAVESALLLARDGDCASVSISYRRNAFARCRSDNRTAIDAAIAEGHIRPVLPSNVTRIDETTVTLDVDGESQVLRNDAVIVQIGGSAPAELLRSFGIEMVTKHAEA